MRLKGLHVRGNEFGNGGTRVLKSEVGIGTFKLDIWRAGISL